LHAGEALTTKPGLQVMVKIAFNISISSWGTDVAFNHG